MPKLPKGAQSLGDIVRMRGRGGQTLRQLRKSNISGQQVSELGQRRAYKLRMPFEITEMEQKQKAKAYKVPRIVHSVKLSDIHTGRLRHPETAKAEGLGDLISGSKVKALDRRYGQSIKSLSRLISIARAAGKLSAIGQIITLPEQLKEYKEMKKPLHKREQEKSATRM